MGGGHDHHDPNHHIHPVYQTHIWNQKTRRFLPEDPPNWKRNTAITFGFIAVAITTIFYISAQHEVRIKFLITFFALEHTSHLNRDDLTLLLDQFLHSVGQSMLLTMILITIRS